MYEIQKSHKEPMEISTVPSYDFVLSLEFIPSCAEAEQRRSVEAEQRRSVRRRMGHGGYG
jgi:hypothetical protein